MSNKRVSVIPAGSGTPGREDTSTGEWDFNSVRIGPDNLPITQDGSGGTARLSLGSRRLKAADGTEADDVATKGQAESYASGLVSGLTASEGLVRSGDDFQIADLGITSGKFAVGAVNEAAIGAGAVTNTKLGADSVTADKIATGAVGNTELASDAVTADKIATGAVGNTELATDAVTADKVATGAIGADELATDAVTNVKIAADAVTADKIATGAVGNTELASDAVTADKIATGAVGNTELATDAVTADKIATGAVGNDELATDAVTNSKIANDAVGTTEIINLAVTDAKLAANSVTNTKIEDGAVSGNKIHATLKGRLGVQNTSYDAYTSTNVIGTNESYPQALSTLDGAMTTVLTNVPLEEVFTAGVGGMTTLTCSTISWNAGDAQVDITVRVNGKLLAPVDEFTKASTTQLDFTFTIPEGAQVIVRKERTGAVASGGGGGIAGIAVEDNGSLIVGTSVRLNFTGSVSVTDAGLGEATVNIVGADLSSVTQDIVPSTDDVRSLGSGTIGWKALYLSDQTNGDVYRVEIVGGVFQAVKV